MMPDLPELEINDEGMFVEILQVLLRWQGYRIKPTGNFDYTTYEALYDFRQQHYLSGETVTDPETWKLLFTE